MPGNTELLDTLSPQFDSRRVHVGLDEPWELPRSRVPDYIEWIRELRELPERIERLTQRLSGLSADQATMKAHEDNPLVIGTRASDDPVAALGLALDALPQFVMQDRRVPLATAHYLHEHLPDPCLYLSLLETRPS